MGIPLQVHWTLLLLIGYISWEGWMAAGWFGAGWLFLYCIAIFTCVVLHELGHAMMARRFGVNVPRILLLPIGGMAEFDSIPRVPRQEIAIALAGPAVNALLVGILFAGGVRFPEGWDALAFELSLPDFGRHLVLMNAIMGIFNLAPVFPMDGGRVFRAVLAMKLPYLRATFWAATTGKILAVAGAVTALWWFDHVMGAVLFAFILVAGEVEYRGVKRRERADAHWRAVLDRFYREEAPETILDEEKK